MRGWREDFPTYEELKSANPQQPKFAIEDIWYMAVVTGFVAVGALSTVEVWQKALPEFLTMAMFFIFIAHGMAAGISLIIGAAI